MQVDLVLEHPDAAAKLANDVDADAAAAKRERVVGLEQRFDIECIGNRFGQRRRLVALPLALTAGAGSAAGWLLAGAVAATGIRSPLGDLLRRGPRPLLAIAAASAAALGLALASALLLVR